MTKLSLNTQNSWVSSILRTLAVAAAIPGGMCLAQGGTMVATPVSAVVAARVPGASTAISRGSAGGEVLHLTVGHSLFMNTKARLRRIYVADPLILTSYTVTPNQLLVTAIAPGASSVVIVDETGHAQSYVVSADLDVSGLRVAMADAMRDDSVRVDGDGNHVTLSGVVKSDAQADQAVKIAGLYSKEVANSLTVVPAHEKQVRLKVRILEVDRSKLAQFGVNIFNPGGNYVGSSTTSQFPSAATLAPGGPVINGVATNTLTVSDPLNFLLYSAKYNVGVTVKDLENKEVLQILAEPTITTISGQKANFLAGGEFPFPVIQPGGGSGATASVTIQFRPYGVKLEFTPFVNEDGTIRLKVAPEVSALDYANAVTISGYTVPALATRRAETQVELRSDQSFAISGLLDKRTTDAYGKTPGIASVPIIGELFKSKSLNHSTSELIVIVTPSIVDPLTDGVGPTEPPMPAKVLDEKKFDKHLPSEFDRDGSHVVPIAPQNLPPDPRIAPTSTPTQTPAPTAGHIASRPAPQAAFEVVYADATQETIAPPDAVPMVASADAAPLPAAPANETVQADAVPAGAVASAVAHAAPAVATAAVVSEPVTSTVAVPVVTAEVVPAASVQEKAAVAAQVDAATEAPVVAAAPPTLMPVAVAAMPVAAAAMPVAAAASPVPMPLGSALAATSPAPVTTSVANAAPAAVPAAGPLVASLTPGPGLPSRVSAPVAVAPVVAPPVPSPTVFAPTVDVAPTPAVANPASPAPTAAVVAVAERPGISTVEPNSTTLHSMPSAAHAEEPSLPSTAASSALEADIPLREPDLPAVPHEIIPPAPVSNPYLASTGDGAPEVKSAGTSDAQRSAMVQIMALSHKEDADTMVAALKRQGYDVAVHQDTRDRMLHLQVGPFASRVDAVAMQQKLLDEGYNATVK